MESTLSPEDLRDVLRHNLRHRREEKGLSQTELAQRIQLNQADISRFEAGKTSPSLETLARLSEALDMSAHSLLDPSLFSSATH